MRIRWTPLQDICQLLESSSPDGAHYCIENEDGEKVAGSLPDGMAGERYALLAHGETRVATAITSAAVPAALRALFTSLCDREISHQATVADMADATARLWRQTNALLRMAASTNLGLAPAAFVEQLLQGLVRSTAFERGVAVLRLPGDETHTVVSAEATRPADLSRLDRIFAIDDDVRVIGATDEGSELLEQCRALLGSDGSAAVARIETESGHYGYLVTSTPDAELLRAEDLKLFGAAGRILSVAVENTHTLTRERQATRLEVENELLSQQAGDMEEMLHVVAHDLRSPMTALYGFIHVALDGVDGLRDAPQGNDQDRSDALTAIAEPLDASVRSIEKLNRMVQRLLDFSRIARQDYRSERVDTGAVVEGVVSALGFQIEERRIEVVVDALPVVEGDSVFLESAFRNLIDNAIKYMGERDPRRIRIGYREAPPAGFFVADTGVGMDESQVGRAFLPFQRFRKDSAPGEGIGLPFVRKVVERHGGRVWCESKVGEGTTFYFALPLAESPFGD